MDNDNEVLQPFQVLIRREADTEMSEAYAWYRSKESKLGVDFRRALDERLLSLEQNPTAYPIIGKQVRRALLRRFPYSILYIIEGHTVIILACFHASRDPRLWQDRVENSDDY